MLCVISISISICRWWVCKQYGGSEIFCRTNCSKLKLHNSVVYSIKYWVVTYRTDWSSGWVELSSPICRRFKSKRCVIMVVKPRVEKFESNELFLRTKLYYKITAKVQILIKKGFVLSTFGKTSASPSCGKHLFLFILAVAAVRLTLSTFGCDF